MKLLAVAQRDTRKGLIDVLALSRSLPLARMLDCYRQRLWVSDTGRVLAGLCYFDDANAAHHPQTPLREPGCSGGEKGTSLICRSPSGDTASTYGRGP